MFDFEDKMLDFDKKKFPSSSDLLEINFFRSQINLNKKMTSKKAF